MTCVVKSASTATRIANRSLKRTEECLLHACSVDNQHAKVYPKWSTAKHVWEARKAGDPQKMTFCMRKPGQARRPHKFYEKPAKQKALSTLRRSLRTRSSCFSRGHDSLHEEAWSSQETLEKLWEACKAGGPEHTLRKSLHEKQLCFHRT